MVPMPHFTSGRTIAAARVLLGLTQKEVADMARVSISTLKRFESGGMLGEPNNNWLAVVAALETAGVEFISENGGGAGVRLRK